MEKTILIIDDQKAQAEGLAKGLKSKLPTMNFIPVFEEKKILDFIENKFYSLAIVDLRMDEYAFDGIELVEKMSVINPFSKFILVSAFKEEYTAPIKRLMLSGKIVDVLEKEMQADWLPKLKDVISVYYDNFNEDQSEINKALMDHYARTKNEENINIKGNLFEHFVSLLFQSIGFNHISKRVKDKSLNEVDLIIRNEIDDPFINKFGKYILVECKNKPEDKVNKNDFIVFKEKLTNTNGLAELGIIATTGYFTWTAYNEATRSSSNSRKIIFLSNPEFEILIKSKNRLEEFKAIIDKQVKDN